MTLFGFEANHGPKRFRLLIGVLAVAQEVPRVLGFDVALRRYFIYSFTASINEIALPRSVCCRP